jgi:hypothetical protein
MRTSKARTVTYVPRGEFLKVFGVQNGKFVVVMSQGINFVVTS